MAAYGNAADDAHSMMNSAAVAWTPIHSTAGLEDTLPTQYQRKGAIAIAATLIVLAALAALFGQGPAPEIRSFIAIAATAWSLADVLTAFLLIAQFYVNGTVLFGVLAGAYAFSGMMTWAYLSVFPGVIRASVLAPGDQQIPIVLWTIWHCTFPALVLYAILNGEKLGRVAMRRTINIATGIIFVAPVLAAAVVTALVFAYRDALPQLVIDGHFAPLWKTAFVPSVIALNSIACVVLLVRRRRLTALSLWLSVATMSATLDALLNLSTTRYSYAWDTGKLITVFTASVVLVMILCDIVGLYGQLARVARVDTLTALPNRRAFDEHLGFVFANARRLRSSIALLLIDVDGFTRVGEQYDHLASDGCLRKVAAELANCATRPLDLVARYSGTTFAVILPDTPLQGISIIAERIRAAVERLEVAHGAAQVGGITVSIGIGMASDAGNANTNVLCDVAARALGDAQAYGHNRVVLRSLETSEATLPLPVVNPAGAGVAAE